MKNYTVQITETLHLDVECVAESEDEAKDAIRSKYKDGVYVLCAENFIGVEFSVVEKEDGHMRDSMLKYREVCEFE